MLARIEPEELESLLVGYGWKPYFVEGSDPEVVHQRMAETLDAALDEIAEIQAEARASGVSHRPRWPMIVLRTPKGWTGPKEVDGQKTEDHWRSHQVPLAALASRPTTSRSSRRGCAATGPRSSSTPTGGSCPSCASSPRRAIGAWAPTRTPTAARCCAALRMPDFRDFAVDVPAPGAATGEATRVLGGFLNAVMRLNLAESNFRLFAPDENASNRLQALYETTGKTWLGRELPDDEDLAADGRVMEILSEHTCQGWLEGYLLTGRHGLFSCYEAFIHIVDSMFNQHAKWLKTTRELGWRAPIASLNYLLTSHVWRQDHNGFSHQDPGFIDHVVNKKADIVRVWLPPDANTLLAVADQCLRSRDLVNVIVAGKQPAPQFLDMNAAIRHCTKGVGIWDWASNDQDDEPDVVMACAGDVPTLETLAAVDILRRQVPQLRVRVVNVVDLMTLQPESEHPHGLSDREFDAIFTPDKPIVFAYHGYPWLIHRLTYRRTNHANLHVRGYKEEGTTTTPFDMCVLNEIDRYSLVCDALDRVPRLGHGAVYVRHAMRDKHIEHKQYVHEHGVDMPEVLEWTWPSAEQ